jgi:RIO-like serine/threonine protein kinase
MKDKTTEKTYAEAIEEIIGILKESALYSELSQEEQENLIKIILSS